MEPLDGPPQDEVIRIDLPDGRITSIAQGGAIWPHASPDGQFVYYFAMPRWALSRVPANGGASEILPVGRNPSMWATVVTNRYIYLFEDRNDRENPLASDLIRFDPASREAVALSRIPFRPRRAYLSPDSRYLYLEQSDDPKRRVVVVSGL